MDGRKPPEKNWTSREVENELLERDETGKEKEVDGPKLSVSFQFYRISPKRLDGPKLWTVKIKAMEQVMVKKKTSATNHMAPRALLVTFACQSLILFT